MVRKIQAKLVLRLHGQGLSEACGLKIPGHVAPERGRRARRREGRRHQLG